MSKHILKQRAIWLRKSGFSYSKILVRVPVAKSTLSLWLRSVGLSASQKQRISEMKLLSQKRGAAARRNKRIIEQNRVIEQARGEIGRITKRELWLIGIALYWAEGGKEKDTSIGSGVRFSNSDPRMILLFIRWLRVCADVPLKDISADIYIHESHRHTINNVVVSWSTALGQPRTFFRHVYFKKNKILTKRKNTGALYIGLLRVNIRASSMLNRQITGWIKGITS